MSGHYIETETTPHGCTVTNNWNFAPCGNGCANVTGDVTGQARLVNNQWSLDSAADAACSDGSNVPAAEAEHFIWDPNTLVGTSKITLGSAACGWPVGQTETNHIQLRRAS